MQKPENIVKTTDKLLLSSLRDEVTYNKIQRHLTDINDTISEDDIRNIQIYSVGIEIEVLKTNLGSKNNRLR